MHLSMNGKTLKGINKRELMLECRVTEKQTILFYVVQIQSVDTML